MPLRAIIIIVAVCLAGLAAVFYAPSSQGRSNPQVQDTTRARVNPHGPIEIDCASCHRTEAWTPLRDSLAFDHDRQTDFPLTGRHDLTDCQSCHLDLRFDQPEAGPQDCATCHVDVHQGAFVKPCASCHNTTAFQAVDGQAIHASTRFPLTGAHAQVTCQSCHQSDMGGAFAPLEAECLECHQAEYERAHAGTGFPTTCQNCHSTVDWRAVRFVEHDRRFFPINSGNHAGTWDSCQTCHTQPGDFSTFTCLTCHEHNRPDMDDEHEDVAGYVYESTACLSCHPNGDEDDADD